MEPRQRDAGWAAPPGTKAWQGYAVAVGGTVLAALIRWALVRSLGDLPPFITFYPVVLTAALLGGTGPGVLATILGGLAAGLFFIPPIGRLWPLPPGQIAGMSLFLGINLAISIVGGRLRAAYSQARLQAVALGAAANAIVITDRKGVIQWVNPAFERLTGYPAAEAVGLNPRVLQSGQHDQAFFQHMWTAILTGQVWQGELLNKHKDGRLYHEEMTITPVRDPRGAITHFIAIKQDITARKQAEAALRAAREELARANADLERKVQQRTAKLRETIEELEGFSYSIVHDMRAPLRAMQTFAALAQESCAGCSQPEGQEFFRRIQVASNRLDRLITDALTYSKVIRQEVPLTPVEAAGLLRGIVETYPALQSPAVDIHIAFDTVPVLGNEAALTQVFSNLLDNAVKFVAPGVHPRIRVWAEGGGEGERRRDGETEKRREGERERGGDGETESGRRERVRIWVEDNGIGIPKEAQEKIFDMFQRMHRTEEYPGTGIGLAIVRKAMERMGGRVGVESSPGQGSRFWIELAKAPQSDQPGTAPPGG